MHWKHGSGYNQTFAQPPKDPRCLTFGWPDGEGTALREDLLDCEQIAKRPRVHHLPSPRSCSLLTGWRRLLPAPTPNRRQSTPTDRPQSCRHPATPVSRTRLLPSLSLPPPARKRALFVLRKVSQIRGHRIYVVAGIYSVPVHDIEIERNTYHIIVDTQPDGILLDPILPHAVFLMLRFLRCDSLSDSKEMDSRMICVMSETHSPDFERPLCQLLRKG